MVTISKYGLEKDAVWEEKAESGKRVAISFFSSVLLTLQVTLLAKGAVYGLWKGFITLTKS